MDSTVAASERARTSGRHLAPVQLRGRSSTTGPCVNKQGARCSNKGFLPISTADYLSRHVRQKSLVKLEKCVVLTWREPLAGAIVPLQFCGRSDAVRYLEDPRQSELFDVFADILAPVAYRRLTSDS